MYQKFDLLFFINLITTLLNSDFCSKNNYNNDLAQLTLTLKKETKIARMYIVHVYFRLFKLKFFIEIASLVYRLSMQNLKVHDRS